MRHLSIAIVALFLFCACSEEKRDDNVAAKAAKEYYDHLLAGRYLDFINGMADADSLPPSYREQLLANAKQFVAVQKENHGGLVDVRVVSTRTDSVLGRTEAYLLLCFGDSAKEEVVVPMVERDGKWLMK